MAIDVTILLFFIFVSISLCIWIVTIHSKEKTQQFQIPFSYIHAGELDPEALTADIMNAIGYPDAIPFVTKEDRFSATLYNRPNMQNDLEFKTITSRFKVRVPSTDKLQIMSYEFQLPLQKDHLIIIESNETTFNNSSLEQPVSPVPNDAFSLNELLSAVRDFPADSYREHTQYGDEDADLYDIRYDGGGALIAESFFFNKHGYLDTTEKGEGDEILLLMSHLSWGEIRDESLPYDDPLRYYNFGGEGRANLLYIPEDSDTRLNIN